MLVKTSFSCLSHSGSRIGNEHSLAEIVQGCSTLRATCLESTLARFACLEYCYRFSSDFRAAQYSENSQKSCSRIQSIAIQFQFYGGRSSHDARPQGQFNAFDY